MPIDTGLTDALVVKLFHLGKSDQEIAEQFGVTVQAVSKRRMKLGLARRPVSRQVNEWLATRWKVFSPQEGTGHHNRYSAKALRAWLRLRLGDKTLSAKQIDMAERWERRLRREGLVLCYDPDTEEGWYYRPRLISDDRLVIDWPKDLPFPDERFRRALTLPREGAARDV